MSMSDLIDPAFSSQLCLTLLHSVWQVALVTLVAVLLDRLWKKPSPERSYTLHITALVIALVAMPVTWFVVESPNEASVAPISPVASPLSMAVNLPVVRPGNVAEVAVAGRHSQQQSTTSTSVVLSANSKVAASKPTPATVDPPAIWRRFTMWIAACYFIGVIAMFGRLAFAMKKAARLSAIARPITDESLLAIIKTLAQNWSMKVVPVLAQAEQIFVPQVVGLLRPTILLPASAMSGLSVDELELILTHEVAHIRRYDMWAALIQRLAESILFFNPAIWYLNRRISELREYCCDDIACKSQSVTDPPPHLRYAHALLRVLELGHPNVSANPQLTALAVSGRSPSELRRRITRLFGEPIQEPLRMSREGFLICLAVAGLMLLGQAFLPTGSRENSATAANPALEEEAEPESTDTPASDKEKANSDRTFQLNVVGPGGAPVSNALVSIRSNQPIKSEQIRRGTFDRMHSYGAYAKTNELGQLAVTWSRSSGYVVFAIEQPGYGPYWAQWDSRDLPDELTAELDAAWSVGGIVVDEAGAPVADAEVSPSVDFKKRPGDSSHMGVGGSVRTDAQGRWRYDLVPVSSEKDHVHVSIDHPNHQPQRLPLPRSEFEIKADASPNRRITLKKGVTITGNVTDDSRNPIEGATVRTKFVNEIREAKTDAAGTYSIGGCEPRMTRIVAFAKGRAMELQEVLVDPDMEPVDFTMKPGGHVRVRIVNENGKGLPKASVHFQRWRGHVDYSEFNHVHKDADENGVWEWNEAPLDEFQADICHPTGMQLSSRPITARKEEYVFSPPPALVVSGTVTDSKTKMPIPSFRAISGLRNAPGLSSGEYWDTRNSTQFTDGKYRVTNTREAPAHMWRIEAPGYKVAVSRDIKMNEGTIDIDFELQPAADISAVICNSDGTPVAGAQIAFGGSGDQISVKNGVFDSQTYATRFVTDTEGRFHIPERSTPFHLVILHDNGFAHLNSADGPIPFEITLTPWARVQGTFRVGNTVSADVPISVYGSVLQSWRDESNPSIFSRIEFKTDSEGRFEFDRITPGLWRIGRNITMMADDGATEVTSAQHVAMEFVAGTTTAVTLGGVGRPLVGKLIPPDGTEMPNWKFALLMVNADLVQPSLPESMSVETPNETEAERAVRWDTWEKTDEGKTWSAAYRAYRDEEDRSTQFRATIDRDGSFRIDDMPAGNYVLTMPFFNDKAPGKLSEFHFTVPNVEDGTQPEPLDLGNLQLEKKMATPSSDRPL